MKHWFWHIVAMFCVCDLYTEEVTDSEWKAYKEFMNRHGFDRVP